MGEPIAQAVGAVAPDATVSRTRSRAKRNGARRRRNGEVTAIVRELRKRRLLRVAEQVAARHHIEVDELLGGTQGRPEARARRELWALVYKQIPSIAYLGRLFRRHHATILVGIRKHDSECGRTRACQNGAGTIAWFLESVGCDEQEHEESL